jgi:hypothetical protein
MKKELTISELTELGYEADCKAGWIDPNNPNVKPDGQLFMEFIGLAHSELSEALEDYRNGHPLNEIWYEEGGKPCGVPTELADTVIRIMGQCRKHNINLHDAILEKINYNKTRPFRHGGKVV